MKIGRRTWLMIAGATAAWGLPGTQAQASTRAERRLKNRLGLWHQFAQRSQNLRARYQLTRHTSILQHPLVATGTLVFVASDRRLVFFDDSEVGAKTQIDAGGMSIVPRDHALRASEPKQGPAAQWLATRLLRLFSPGEPDDLIAAAEVSIPRGSGMRLLLTPGEDSAVGRELRSMQLRFDPTTGAVVYIEVEEARGDRLVIGLSDHRQNVDPTTLSEFLGEGPVPG